MLGIVRNRRKFGYEPYTWFNTLFYTPRHMIEVFSLGFFSTSNYRIIRNFMPWMDCLIHLVTNLIVIMSFCYFRTDWRERYWAKLEKGDLVK